MKKELKKIEKMRATGVKRVENMQKTGMRKLGLIPSSPNRDLGLLLLRGTVGSLLMGHGAQKLFGAWGGPGLKGASGWMESMGFRPGQPWALMAGLGEFGGGLLTALGLLNPAGSLGIAGSMAMAAAKVHSGKPIWITEGGAEFTLTNLAAATALALAGPGRYSLDRALGLKLPRWVGPVGALSTAAIVGYASTVAAARSPQPRRSLRPTPTRPRRCMPRKSRRICRRWRLPPNRPAWNAAVRSRRTIRSTRWTPHSTATSARSRILRERPPGRERLALPPGWLLHPGRMPIAASR